jgi:hypothetical protein
VEKPAEVAVVHESNDWGIECVDDEAPEQPTSSQPPQPETVQGVRFAYDAPGAQKEEVTEEEAPKEAVDLAKLRAQLKGL